MGFAVTVVGVPRLRRKTPESTVPLTVIVRFGDDTINATTHKRIQAAFAADERLSYVSWSRRGDGYAVLEGNTRFDPATDLVADIRVRDAVHDALGDAGVLMDLRSVAVHIGTEAAALARAVGY